MSNKEPWYIEEFRKKFGVVSDPLEDEPERGWTNGGELSKPLEDFITSVAQKEREAGRLEGINSVVLERKGSEWIDPSETGYTYPKGWDDACEALEKIKSKLKE